VPERRQEEQRLFMEYRRSGDRAARDALIERFLPLARSYCRGFEPLDDLEQVASLALIKAVDGFDVERGTAFSSYAVPSLVGALKRQYRDRIWSVRPPRDLQELALRVTQLNDDLTAVSGVPPTVALIGEQAGVDVEPSSRRARPTVRCAPTHSISPAAPARRTAAR
jgi:RNA polymerase sigma-B factor